mmetsp:Transcript_41908/g.110740  ORF Transcript_41908/g.110740 Transcript_41908/m.110740 type:complete len:255 (+) Transcript_41908:1321-2085(+)
MVDVGRHDHLREAAYLGRVARLAQRDLDALAQLGLLGDAARDDRAENGEAAAALELLDEGERAALAHHEAGGVEVDLAHHQDLRPPVLGVRVLVSAQLLELHQRGARALVAQADGAVAPLSLDLLEGDVDVEEGDDEDRAEGDEGRRVEHDEEAEDHAHQRRQRVVELEARSPVGLLHQVLQQARRVDREVAQQEEHRDDRSDEVDLAREDAARGDAEGQDESELGLSLAAEAREDGHEVVVGDRLQQPRRAGE